MQQELGGTAFAGLHLPHNDAERYGLAYAEFTGPLILSVQQLDHQLQRMRIMLVGMLMLALLFGGVFVIRSLRQK